MSVEIPSEADNFGRGGLHLDHLSSTEFSWERYGQLIGWENGCPQPRTNMAQEGAETYVRGLVPSNAVWGFIVEYLAAGIKEANPTLHEDILTGSEEVGENEAFDEDCVPTPFSKGRKRYGLARDSAYLLTKAIVEETQQAQTAGGDPQKVFFGELNRLQRLMRRKEIKTMAQLWRRFSPPQEKKA